MSIPQFLGFIFIMGNYFYKKINEENDLKINL